MLAVLSDVAKRALRSYSAAMKVSDELTDDGIGFAPLAEIMDPLYELLEEVVYNHLQVLLGDEDEDVITGKDPLDLIKEQYVEGTIEDREAAIEKYSFEIEVAADFYIKWARQEVDRVYKEYDM